MDQRQFLWGLSNGVWVLALAGTFWIGLAIGMTAPRVYWVITALSTLVQAGGLVGLIWAGARLRRRSGFRRTELRTPAFRQNPETRRIVIRFGWTVCAQAALIGLAVWLCLLAQAETMIWPSIGLVVSVHFSVLGWIFHVRAYHATALAGSLVALAGFATAHDALGVVVLGWGMMFVMWTSAIYLLVSADRIAAGAIQEPWVA